VLITVFGATGGTGREVVRLALDRGHDVTAVARRPEQLDIASERLVVRPGDVLEYDSLPPALAGADAVLSTLGSAAGRAATTVYSTGVANILKAMQEAEVRRFVGVSAAPVVPREASGRFERTILFPILHRFFGGAYDDMRRMEDVLGASTVDWTVLRPPMLTDKPARRHYRTALGENVRRGRSITRADLAAAMLDALDDTSAFRAAVGVAN
jgi:putative NADH-flavin reductase